MPQRDMSRIKDEELYERLRDHGDSEEKAARIASAAAKQDRSEVGRKAGRSGSSEDWTVDELQDRAKGLGLHGCSHKKQDELIEMLRNH